LDQGAGGWAGAGRALEQAVRAATKKKPDVAWEAGKAGKFCVRGERDAAMREFGWCGGERHIAAPGGVGLIWRVVEPDARLCWIK